MEFRRDGLQRVGLGSRPFSARPVEEIEGLDGEAGAGSQPAEPGGSVFASDVFSNVLLTSCYLPQDCS